jgi:hypothetical protein
MAPARIPLATSDSTSVGVSIANTAPNAAAAAVIRIRGSAGGRIQARADG